MKNFFQKILSKIKENKIKAILSLLGISFFVTLAVAFMNLAATVSLILSLVLTPTFKIGKLEFVSGGKIRGENIQLIYKDQVLVDAPLAYIEYSLKGRARDWLKRIAVFDSKVYIERDGSDVNIADAFSTGGDNKTGTGVPIGTIDVINADVTFKDLSYEFPIEKHLHNTDGYVSFHEIKGIDLLFKGKDGDQEISYSFGNELVDYQMNINVKNGDIDTNLLQYGFYYEPVQYKSGKADLDLTISSEGLFGNAHIRDMVVEYADFDEPAKNIDGKVEFLGDKITIDADFDMFGKKRDFVMDFDFEKGLNIDILLGKMTYDEISKYSILKNIKLDPLDLKFDDVVISLKTDENQKFSVDVNYKLEDRDYGYLKLENAKGDVHYSEDTVVLNILKGDILANGIKNEVEIHGILEDEIMDITYGVNDFLGSLELVLGDEELKFSSNDGLFVGHGSYNSDTGLLKLSGDYDLESEKDKFILQYDLNKRSLDLFSGEIDLDLLGFGVLKLIGEGKNNEVYLDQIEYTQDKLIVMKGIGEIDLNTLFYRLAFDTNNLKYNFPINDEKLDLLFSASGEITGEKEDFQLDANGTIEKVDYRGYAFNGIKFSTRITDEKIQILDFHNGMISIRGNYYLDTKYVEAAYRIKNLSNEYLKLEFPKFFIKEAEGEVFGNVENLQGDLLLLYGEVYPVEEVPISLAGVIEFRDGIFSSDKIKINKNSYVSGMFNLDTLEYSAKAEIFEPHLSRYVSNRNLKYRLIGRAEATGRGMQIDAVANLNLDEVYYQGEKIGSLKGKFNYSGEDLRRGVLASDDITFIKNKIPIAVLKGNVDLLNETINLAINENSINIQDITGEELIKGIFSLDASIEGSLKSPDFNVSLESSKISVEDFHFTDVNVEAKGDINKIALEDLSFYYERNKMVVGGSYEIPTSKYILSLNSKEINLDFLNLILKDSSIKNVKGFAEMNIDLSNESNIGDFNGKGVSFDTGDLAIAAENLNFDITLNGKKVEIKELKGDLNGGVFDAQGYFNMPSLVDVRKNPDYYKNLDYNIGLDLGKVTYDRDGLKVVIDSNLKVTENKISGDINLSNGKMTGIPGLGDGISIWGILKKVILAAVPLGIDNEESISRDFSGSFLDENLSLDLNLRITDGIVIDIIDIWNMIEDVNGVIKGGGTLKGPLDKLVFLGQVDIEKGEFVLGESDYKIQIARLVFNNPHDYIPNINPRLTFEAFDSIANTDMSLVGELKSLNFRVRSQDETSSGSLASLFYADKNEKEENVKVGPSLAILRNLLGAQITNSFLGPASRSLKRMFGLTKLRITADIADSFSETLVNEEVTEGSYFNFGIKIVAEEALYKDKLFAVAHARISASKDAENKTSSSTGYDQFDSYSVGLEYRYAEGESFGIGVQNRGRSITSGEGQKISRENLNYFIDFKVEKKYDSLMDIYRGLMNRIFR